MEAEPRPSVGIIGMGRLGSSLAAALNGAGFKVAIARGRYDVQHTADAAGLVFLAVPDRAISEVAEQIAWRRDQWAAHCSGALGREQLLAAEAQGALTGCFHPLQTFPSRAPEPERFAGIAVGIEGPAELGTALEALARAVGSQPFRLEGVDRALYHAAAVVASNHLVALAAAAGRLWSLAGLPPETGRPSLAPLMAAATKNVTSMELGDALTGPVARGDVGTVARHLAALETDPALRELYRRLSLELLRLPLAIADDRRDALAALLTEPGKEATE